MPARHSSSNSRPRNVLNPARAVLRPATATNENSRSPQSRQRSQNAARLRPRRNRSRSSSGRPSLSHSRSRSRRSVRSGSCRARSASHADSNRTLVSEADLQEQDCEDEEPPSEVDVTDQKDRKAKKSRRRKRRAAHEHDADNQSQGPAPDASKRKRRRRKEAADAGDDVDPEVVENGTKAPKKKKKHKKSAKDIECSADEEGQQASNKEDAAKSARLRELIKGVYERRCPDKLKKLPAILDKYSGLELEVYEKACRKYGETPETDFSLPQTKADEDRVPTIQGRTVAPRGSSTRPPNIPGQPRPGSGGSWPFVEDYSGNSASSSDSEAEVAASLSQSGLGVRTVAERPPGQWQPDKRPPMPPGPAHLGAASHPAHLAHPPTRSWVAPPGAPWGLAPPPSTGQPMRMGPGSAFAHPNPWLASSAPSRMAAPAPSIGSAWGEPTGSAWGEPAESKSQSASTPAPAPPMQVKKGSQLDRDLENLLYGDVRKVAAVGPTSTPIPAPPEASQPPGVPGPVPPGLVTIRLETFLGDWRDSMGNRVYVEWSRNRNNHGQLDVELAKPRGGNPIKLNVRQTGSRFQCGHYDLDVGKSNESRIVWLDVRNDSKSSVWTR
eukprot:TRINITY_DN8158_c0_g1_i1.p1 TRINITY_DN8158_c0_g1~~TRINITY_DN8158_c0_g1_i1.p1  ORF type:complete len:611 (-),score=90.56 TRINITY_DN8158_c0_g1_i1:322-2154(-)